MYSDIDSVYQEWKQQLAKATTNLKNRDEKVAECRRQIEKNMQFVAVTGVEDKLQDGVV